MTLRKDLAKTLGTEPRSMSALARELGIRRQDVEEELRHAIRSAQAAGYRLDVLPARCRSCGFTFDEDRLSKPSKCPACRSSRLYEAQIRLLQPDEP